MSHGLIFLGHWHKLWNIFPLFAISQKTFVYQSNIDHCKNCQHTARKWSLKVSFPHLVPLLLPLLGKQPSLTLSANPSRNTLCLYASIFKSSLFTQKQIMLKCYSATPFSASLSALLAAFNSHSVFHRGLSPSLFYLTRGKSFICQ